MFLGCEPGRGPVSLLWMPEGRGAHMQGLKLGGELALEWSIGGGIRGEGVAVGGGSEGRRGRSLRRGGLGVEGDDVDDGKKAKV